LLVTLASFLGCFKASELGDEDCPWVGERVEFGLEAFVQPAHTVFKPAADTLKEVSITVM
jgi:hypothetical protein